MNEGLGAALTVVAALLAVTLVLVVGWFGGHLIIRGKPTNGRVGQPKHLNSTASASTTTKRLAVLSVVGIPLFASAALLGVLPVWSILIYVAGAMVLITSSVVARNSSKKS